LRREGLYSSNLTRWRRQRQKGQLKGLRAKKRGRKKTPRDEMRQELEQLRRQKQQLEDRLAQAETIIEVQKKLSTLLGLPQPQTQPSANR
jgi:transposase-like protein